MSLQVMVRALLGAAVDSLSSMHPSSFVLAAKERQ
jgi:hypothetical protein